MKLKEQMINCQAEFQEGLDTGVNLCLDMINKSLGTNFTVFGHALAHIEVELMKSNQKTDWK
jgi:hypothetical protein